jgi:hypothetical protein
LALVKLPLVMADVDQPTAIPLLVECFVIGRQSTRRLSHMQRENVWSRGAQQWRVVAGDVRKEEEVATA